MKSSPSTFSCLFFHLSQFPVVTNAPAIRARTAEPAPPEATATCVVVDVVTPDPSVAAQVRPTGIIYKIRFSVMEIFVFTPMQNIKLASWPNVL